MKSEIIMKSEAVGDEGEQIMVVLGARMFSP